MQSSYSTDELAPEELPTAAAELQISSQWFECCFDDELLGENLILDSNFPLENWDNFYSAPTTSPEGLFNLDDIFTDPIPDSVSCPTIMPEMATDSYQHQQLDNIAGQEHSLTQRFVSGPTVMPEMATDPSNHQELFNIAGKEHSLAQGSVCSPTIIPEMATDLSNHQEHDNVAGKQNPLSQGSLFAEGSVFYPTVNSEKATIFSGYPSKMLINFSSDNQMPDNAAVEAEYGYTGLLSDVINFDMARSAGVDFVERESGPPHDEAGAEIRIRRVNNRRGHWSKTEHRLFLTGLGKYGRGNWEKIATKVVMTRTAAQVASHAQKFFLRRSSEKYRRSSGVLHITSVDSDSSRA